MFTNRDLQLFEQRNIPLIKAHWQIEQLKKGSNSVFLASAITRENGIVVPKDQDKYIEKFESTSKTITKFVPASGAATRMFKALFEFRKSFIEDENFDLEKNQDAKLFIDNIKKFPFYHELNKLLVDKGGIERLINEKNYEPILTGLLDSDGLSYLNLPKGLLSFHFYAGGIARTPFEEHLSEGAKYARSANNNVYLHFTVSPEHLEAFVRLKNKIVPKYENLYSVKYIIEFSIQNPATDTIALTKGNKLVYTNEGDLMFRPGGHGALIENLDQIESDIIYIKNIDNVVPEKNIETTVKYKKVLGGILIEIQQKVFSLLKKLTKAPDAESVSEALDILKNQFNLSGTCIKEDLDSASLIESLIERLNRPIRVCGVVPNKGEPGGGPFLIRNKGGGISPQIVEVSQIDMDDDNQKKVLNSSTHFNPVDIVCAVKDFEGNKFDLSGYVDNDTFFIAQKSKAGLEFKALELPGLWNGAMAGWNTVFVEVPVHTFTPVKTIFDLLRESHQ